MFDHYQSFYRELDSKFKIKGDPTLFACIGMAGEAGECLGLIKRVLRGEAVDRIAYILELGDVLGYLAMVANYQNLSLGSMVDANWPLECIQDRQQAILQLFKIAAQTLEIANSEKSNKCQQLAIYLKSMLFHIHQCAYSVDSTIETVMSANEAKLRDRIRNNTLLGTGDKR